MRKALTASQAEATSLCARVSELDGETERLKKALVDSAAVAVAVSSRASSPAVSDAGAGADPITLEGDALVPATSQADARSDTQNLPSLPPDAQRRLIDQVDLLSAELLRVHEGKAAWEAEKRALHLELEQLGAKVASEHENLTAEIKAARSELEATRVECGELHRKLDTAETRLSEVGGALASSEESARRDSLQLRRVS